MLVSLLLLYIFARDVEDTAACIFFYLNKMHKEPACLSSASPISCPEFLKEVSSHAAEAGQC